MFDDRKNIDGDLMIRSILEDAQEPVPERIWERVEAGLDQKARRKVTALWWRRSAVAGAVAAAVAAIMILEPSSEPDILVPTVSDNGLIAVVGPETAAAAEEGPEVLIAEAPEVMIPAETAHPVPVSETVAVRENIDAQEVADIRETVDTQEAESDETAVRFPDEWDKTEEADEKGKGIRTSFVVSGITGTNGNTSSAGKNFIQRPQFSTSPIKTGIKENNTTSTYGIPLSVGAGVRMDLSQKWSLGIGLNWSFLSRRFSGTYTKVGNDGQETLSVSSDIRNTQHYLGIPLNLYYNIASNRNINFYAYAGGTAEICLADRYEILNSPIVHKENPKGIQLSSNLGIGVEFMLGKHMGLYVDPSLRYYFDNGQPKSIRTVQPLMLGFEIGARFRL